MIINHAQKLFARSFLFVFIENRGLQLAKAYAKTEMNAEHWSEEL